MSRSCCSVLLGLQQLVLILPLILYIADAWIPPQRRQHLPRFYGRRTSRILSTTQFEADLYFGDDDDQKNPYEDDFDDGRSASNPLQVSTDTRLVIGLNKYSHDTTICAADAATGQVLFALSKERLTRHKHDGGNSASLVDACLESLGLDLESIDTVVMNNHHHRILPMESNLRHNEWESGLSINGGTEDGYDDPENLLSDCRVRHELSHHLAHAYSTVTQAPFSHGLCVVSDGMGETFRTMQHAAIHQDPNYTSDLLFDDWECVPHDLQQRSATSLYDWREAESIYVFAKNETHLQVKPIWKRFTPENTPPTLYNHGFENMDSLGALYSRTSSHIFGNWNACGKVMGLAPWAIHSWKSGDAATGLKPQLHLDQPIIQGHLYNESSMQIDRSLLEGLPLIARNDPDLFDEDGEQQRKRYDFDDNNQQTQSQSESSSVSRLPTRVALEAIALAHRIQIDLEVTLMDLVQHFQHETGQSNLCLAGGVALNSVVNGRLARELGFDQTFISPYPGDDGIAVGCCAFGLFGNADLTRHDSGIKSEATNSPPVWKAPLSPYLGPLYMERDMQLAIEEADPWIDVETIRNDDERLQMMANEIESGGVVAWFHSRSELGPRALGHRSILADPRKKGLVRFINEHVKSRESFRPFAPSVLEEEAREWFDLGPTKSSDCSPFMSMTAMVHPDKRPLMPAVTHIDGSSRLQTVTRVAEPLYHQLIQKFMALTGIPLVLNTSFNTMPGEPIVETPSDAIRSFLYSMGSIEMLVLGDHIIRRRKPDVKRLLGEVSLKKGRQESSSSFTVEPACPQRTGRAEFQSTFALEQEGIQENDEDSAVTTTTRVRMPDRPLHGLKNEWFELLDELEGELLSVCDGTVTLNDMMVQYTSVPAKSDTDDSGNEEESKSDEIEEAQVLLQNIVHRLVRLYEHTLISW